MDVVVRLEDTLEDLPVLKTGDLQDLAAIPTVPMDSASLEVQGAIIEVQGTCRVLGCRRGSRSSWCKTRRTITRRLAKNFAAVMKRIRADSLDKFIDAATPSMNCDAHARRASCLANCPWKANHHSWVLQAGCG